MGSESPKFQRCVFINRVTNNFINVLTLQAIAIITVYILWLAISVLDPLYSTLHICLTTVGCFLLTSEGILLLTSNNILPTSVCRNHKVLIHGVIIGLGSVITIAGISIKIQAKHEQEKYHFRSAHAITGLISIICLIVTCIYGLVIANIQTIKKFMSLRPVWWKLSHSILGMLTYGTGMISLCYGYHTWWFQTHAEWESRIVCTVVTAATATWITLGTIKTLYYYLESITD